uniref:kelch-like protein 3 n=1 Tax=Styela clava TaxID=7725 RepID=UPI00193A5BA5|nr:kelch-like protein 3 [Styela clava]
MEVERTIPMDKNAHDAELLENLNRMRENKMFCDFLIKVGSEEIPVHKNVVSAGSDYFGAMLSHDTKESQAGVVNIKESSPVCVKKCIDFIYTGTGAVADENREELMLVAHMMQLQRLCDGIAVFLADDLGSESFVSTQRIASMFNCVNLKEHCNAFALENFCSVVLSKDFKLLEDDYIRFLMKAENVKASTPDKCKALITWTQHEPDNRAKFFEEIFKSFDFSKLSVEYMTYLVKNEPLVSNSLFCVKLLFFHKGANVRDKDHTIMTVGPDNKENNVIAVFDQSLKSIQCFSPEKNTWTKLQNITTEIAKTKFRAVVLGNDIYVLMYDRRNYRLVNYGDTSATWERLEDRSNDGRLQAVTLNGLIYAFDDSSNSSKAVEKYQLSNDSWVHLIDKPVPARECAVVATEGFIYCIGGYVGYSPSLSDNLKLDPVIPKWHTLPSMPSGRYSASAVAFDQKIHVLGGTPWTCALATVICFDIKSETWTSVANMNLARFNLGSCILGDKIYVIGGANSNDTIEEYDHPTNTWKVVGSLSGKNVYPDTSVALCLPT